MPGICQWRPRVEGFEVFGAVPGGDGELPPQPVRHDSEAALPGVTEGGHRLEPAQSPDGGGPLRELTAPGVRLSSGSVVGDVRRSEDGHAADSLFVRTSKTVRHRRAQALAARSHRVPQLRTWRE